MVASSITAPAGGSDVSCSVTAYDGGSFGNTEYTPNITISNSAPFMSSVSLSPDPAYYGDIITCVASGSDDDGEQLTYDYQWYVNATLDSTVTSNTHSSPIGGEMIECIVSVNDGHVSSAEMSSGNLTITNTMSSTLIHQHLYSKGGIGSTPSTLVHRVREDALM